MSEARSRGPKAPEDPASGAAGSWPRWPNLTAEDEAAVLRVLRTGPWCSAGDNSDVMHAFERAFARLHTPGAEAPPSPLAASGELGSVGLANGTAALIVALDAAGVGPGDEVVVPPYTFIATASACLFLGAIPVFADVDPATLCMDPGAVEKVLTARTRALVPVHFAGCPSDLSSLAQIAHARGLALVEDACQAPGASWQGRPVGAWGQYGCFSFQESKNLSAGEGGAITAQGADLETVWSLHNVGRVRGGAWYGHKRIGQNFRMTALQAALLVSQLDRYPAEMARRQAAARLLTDALRDVAGVRPTAPPAGVTAHAWHLFPLHYEPGRFGGHSRAEFIDALRRRGVPAGAGYNLLSENTALIERGRRNAALAGVEMRLSERSTVPVAAAAAEACVWLPQYVLLASEAMLMRIPTAIRAIQREWA